MFLPLLADHRQGDTERGLNRPRVDVGARNRQLPVGIEILTPSLASCSRTHVCKRVRTVRVAMVYGEAKWSRYDVICMIYFSDFVVCRRNWPAVAFLHMAMRRCAVRSK